MGLYLEESVAVLHEAAAQVIDQQARRSFSREIRQCNPKIVGKLFIGVDTVKSHIRSLMQKTGCKDRTQVVIQAICSGL